MLRIWRTFVIGLALTLGVALAAREAAAHPHVWIDLRTTVVMDDQGRVTAIGQEWLFDPIYSAYVTGGLDPASDKARKALDDLLGESMSNLREYDYFMRVRADGGRLALEDARDTSAAMRGDRMLYRFTVPLSDPVDPRSRDLDIAVFDPTYYIEMLHLEGDVIAFQGANQTGCGARIIEPAPDMNAIALAQSLDRNAAADDTLGAQFAETVIIACK
ncbi:DUF1007 family protein [Thalassobaculum litoreum]|uniref:ABC-type uncharacterized transport system, substrate-binding protein n=1 Tax=Thalassobaculum litoreum DSM 18839 TaxID=1123362 RepID=A0A8G2BIE5_9PROT|nr:DUF1007 family protein [Thalassobaculum litoreum]SDF78038.1 ABC-type uncharacterized transport system, substrate-binding protein [Thalassobaculum litoreum DSM 18839]